MFAAVEGFHFDSRKHLVEYDDVLNKQREIIYGVRRQIVTGDNIKGMILDKINSFVSNSVSIYSAEGFTDSELEKITAEFASIIPFDPTSQKQIQNQLKQFKSPLELSDFLVKIVSDTYQKRETQLSLPVMRQVERWVSLSVVDNFWMDHLDSIDDLREGIGLRGYGQLDPLVEYKNEAFSMFEKLVSSIDYEIAHRIFKVQVQLSPDQVQHVRREQQTKISKVAQSERQRQQTVHPSPSSASSPQTNKKPGRNDPCPCGSGKKYKK